MTVMRNTNDPLDDLRTLVKKKKKKWERERDKRHAWGFFCVCQDPRIVCLIMWVYNDFFVIYNALLSAHSLSCIIKSCLIRIVYLRIYCAGECPWRCFISRFRCQVYFKSCVTIIITPNIIELSHTQQYWMIISHWQNWFIHLFVYSFISTWDQNWENQF